MKQLKHILLGEKYTKIYHEEDCKYDAPHHFEIITADDVEIVGRINFQEGPIKECGVNGIANEDALIMVLARLEGFQRGKYACRENAIAITKLEEALMWLRKRTMGRAQRGAEGTSAI